ncbi:MAG TPA: hypothetical protein VKA54_02275, partial [Gemmatimonadaceae bacterium]|nr:hypothetical protein [Gemmatimonadaceae bacterium]
MRTAAALPERERNRILRRADWRYLLPDLAPARALCLGGEALREACGVISEQVDDSPRPAVAYDLVVAEDPDDAALRSMAAALAPAGVAYTEWSRGMFGAASRAMRAVQRAGFHAPRAYRPWPSLERCRAWIPTDGPAARWWWRNAIGATRVRRDQASAAFGAALARLGVHGRLGIIAFGASASTEPHLVRLARLHDSEPSMDDLASMLLLTPGERSVGKVIALPFSRSGEPLAAIKTARTSQAANGLEREADVLDAVHGRHGGALSGAPRVLFRARALDNPVIGESALTGTPLLARLDASRYPAIAERVTAWLGALAEPAIGAPGQRVHERIVSPALDRFASEFGGVVTAAQLERTRAVLSALVELPAVAEQRDFSPWNVFEGASGLVVLDWESGEPDGVPALDLIYFFTHAAYYLEGAWVSGQYELAYRSAWSPDSAI